MKITHLSTIKIPNSIMVRNYDNKTTVTIACSSNTHQSNNLFFEVGYWKIKYKDVIPKEYNYLNENLTFEPKY